MLTVCQLTDLPEGSSKGFEIGDKAFFLVRKNNQVQAYINSCPHVGIPLEWEKDQFLNFNASLIQCATHGALFLIDSGECISGPCAGQALTKIDVQVVGDEIRVNI